MSRELLFQVTRRDFDETHIRGTGNGGQARNKTSSGVRLRHRASGAVAESTAHRSQEMNRLEAWSKVRETREWKSWFREMCAVTMGRRSLDDKVAEAMRPENFRTQIREDDRWVDADVSALS